MQRNTMIALAVVALLLSMAVRYQQRKLAGGDLVADSTFDLDDDSVEIEDLDDRGAGAAKAKGAGAGKSLAALSKEAAMLELEVRREALRRSTLDPALNAAGVAASRVAAMRSGMSWFPSAAEKSSLAAAEESAAAARAKLAKAQQQEQQLVAKLKPLYGLVSAEFFSEQRNAIKESLQTVSKVAYDNAWWQSMFRLGSAEKVKVSPESSAESLKEVLIQFVLQYAIVYAFAYPFAWAYFVLYHAPTVCYAYMDGWADLPGALGMWLAWAVVMSIPGVILYFGLKQLSKWARENQAAGGRPYRQFNMM